MREKHKTATGLMIILLSVSIFLCQLEWVSADNRTTRPESMTTFGKVVEESTVSRPVVKKQRLKKIKVRVTDREVKRLFGKSAFIGSSIGVGQRMYLDYEGSKYLGNPTMLVKGCYSFTNDQIVGGQYRLNYKGKNCSAKDAVSMAKVKYVFINMGINDMWEGPDRVFQRYKNYLKGIRKKNPGIIIFIESTTPVYYRKQMQDLNNKNINRLNRLLEKYCKKTRDVYFIDISTPLKDSHGGLASAYCSDHYVHITMSGYRVWTKTVCKYVRQWMKQEKLARQSVKIARKEKSTAEYDRASRLVCALEKSSLRQELSRQLKQIKRNLKE
ncbi:MAG: hypothetical protein K6G64_04695 [Eubacterium sp.]|nr:hypothetical protein [Eubacterium sp.]